jgi:hypothetical protein
MLGAVLALTISASREERFLSMELSDGSDSLVDRLVDLILAVLIGLRTNRRECIVELLQPRRTYCFLLDVQRLDPQLTIHQADLKQSALLDSQLPPELSRDDNPTTS